MSNSLSLNVKLESKTTIKCREIIDLLIQNGWNVLKKEKIVYLPLHDDMFDWTVSEKSLDEFLRLVDEKENLNELVGVELNWSNSDIGSHLLMHSGSEFFFQLNIDTKYMQSEYGVPDFGWYAQRIIYILKQQYYIQEYSFEVTY